MATFTGIVLHLEWARERLNIDKSYLLFPPGIGSGVALCLKKKRTSDWHPGNRIAFYDTGITQVIGDWWWYDAHIRMCGLLILKRNLHQELKLWWEEMNMQYYLNWWIVYCSLYKT